MLDITSSRVSYALKRSTFQNTYACTCSPDVARFTPFPHSEVQLGTYRQRYRGNLALTAAESDITRSAVCALNYTTELSFKAVKESCPLRTIVTERAICFANLTNYTCPNSYIRIRNKLYWYENVSSKSLPVLRLISSLETSIFSSILYGICHRNYITDFISFSFLVVQNTSLGLTKRKQRWHSYGNTKGATHSGRHIAQALRGILSNYCSKRVPT